MKSTAIIIVGATGSGKSTLVKKLTKDVHPSRLRVYDVNAEYYKDRDLPDMKDFLLQISTETEVTVIFEEATVFFSNRGNNDMMRRLLVSKRHKRNAYYLIFHSIRSIPYYILDLVNYVAVFHTNDEEKLVKEKLPLLLKAYKAVHKKKFKFKFVKL